MCILSRRLPAASASTRHIYVYPPDRCLPATLATTCHTGVYPPHSHQRATVASTCQRRLRPTMTSTHHSQRASLSRFVYPLRRFIRLRYVHCSPVMTSTSPGPAVPTEPDSAFRRPAVGVRTSTKHLAEAKEFTTRVQSPTHIYSRRLETLQRLLTQR